MPDAPVTAPAAPIPPVTAPASPPDPQTKVVDPKLPAKANFEEFEVKIYNQVGLVYQGQVKALASANSKGEFSILPGHTNFISLLVQPVVIYLPDKQTQKFEVGLGILRCLHNQVEVYTGLLVDKQTEAMAANLQAKNLGKTAQGKGPVSGEAKPEGLMETIRQQTKQE